MIRFRTLLFDKGPLCELEQGVVSLERSILKSPNLRAAGRRARSWRHPGQSWGAGRQLLLPFPGSGHSPCPRRALLRESRCPQLVRACEEGAERGRNGAEGGSACRGVAVKQSGDIRHPPCLPRSAPASTRRWGGDTCILQVMSTAHLSAPQSCPPRTQKGSPVGYWLRGILARLSLPASGPGI